MALTLQFVRFLWISLLDQKSIQLYEVKWKLKSVIKLVLASLSINTFAPLSPFPGSVVFIKKARQNNIPALNITASVILVVLFDYLALSPLLALSLFSFFTNSNIFLYEIIAIIAFLFIIIFLFLILIFGAISPKIMKALFSALEFLINKFHFLFKGRDFFIKD